MLDFVKPGRDFAKLLDKYDSISIISHINPDADAIGTSLGIYQWLKKMGKRVEVANASDDIPRYLDFLLSFHKIKHKLDFADSLVISCDCGSIDRLGFDVAGREIVNIDHHPTNTNFGILNIVDSSAVSSSEIAFGLLEQIEPIDKYSAEAFYAALVSDTRNFTTSNVDADTFSLAHRLVERGVDVPKVTRNMIHRRSLASLRILGVAIDSLRLVENARIAIMTITRDDRKRCGAIGSDLDGIVDYARSLATVEVAVLVVERKNDIKVSLRSKGIDVSTIAQSFGGGGHKVASGFEIKGLDIEEAIKQIVDNIKLQIKKSNI